MIDSVPLIQNVAKDDINTSIIALKKEEKRLEQLIAEADAKIKELNELKVNVSDIVNEVTSGNMHSVTSNAVSEAIKNATSRIVTNNGKPASNSFTIQNVETYCSGFCCGVSAGIGTFYGGWRISGGTISLDSNFYNSGAINVTTNSNHDIIFKNRKSNEALGITVVYCLHP